MKPLLFVLSVAACAVLSYVGAFNWYDTNPVIDDLLKIIGAVVLTVIAIAAVISLGRPIAFRKDNDGFSR